MVEETKRDTHRRSINDIRAPIMMLYVAAFCGGRMGGLPIWVLLLSAAPLLVALSVIFERQLIKELLTWNTKWVSVSISVSAILYVVMYITLQVASNNSLQGAIISDDGALPLLFKMLLDIKGDIALVNPIIAGLVGALVMSVSEEIFWRGYVQVRVMIWAGHIPAVLISTALYAGFYAIMVSTLVAVAAGLCGLVFSIITIRSRTLVPSIIGHALLWLVGIWLLPLV